MAGVSSWAPKRRCRSLSCFGNRSRGSLATFSGLQYLWIAGCPQYRSDPRLRLCVSAVDKISHVAFLLGAAFAVKLGILIGAPLVLYVLLVSRRPARAAALLTLVMATGAVLVSGGSFGLARMQSVFDMVYSENVKAAERSILWNMIHYSVSIVPGMGVHFAIILSVSAIGWAFWSRTGLSGWQKLVSHPWFAVTLGCAFHFGVSLSFGDPFARHMLVLYPFLAIFAITGISYLSFFRTPTVMSLVLILSIALSAFAAWPVLRSFRNDPNIAAARWLKKNTDPDDCILFSQYSGRAKQFLGAKTDASCERKGSSPRFITIHSHWSGRFTGSWWLKPRPKNPGEVYKFNADRMLRFGDRSRELVFWQALFDGRARDWRIVAVFGDDWWTLEWMFLTLIGRGYDQFVTTGKIAIAKEL